MTPEVQLFINHIQVRFTHFEKEWLFNPPSNLPPQANTALTNYLTTFKSYINYKYISRELVFIFIIMPNFYLLYFLTNLALFLFFLMTKDLSSLSKNIEFILNNNNYLDDYHQYDKGLASHDVSLEALRHTDIIDDLRKLDIKVLSTIDRPI